MEIYTAGFAGWSAEEFFNRLKETGVKCLLDVRLHNTSQLAGFAKQRDLEYFLRELADARYEHAQQLAPTPELLAAYKKKQIGWQEYADGFRALLEQRSIHDSLAPDDFATPTVLLCSEHDPEHCHRRLVVEHLADHWSDVRAVDLT